MSSSHDDEEEEEHFGLDNFPDYMDFQGSVDEDYEDLIRMSHYRRGKGSTVKRPKFSNGP
jgi:hypothetical protein